MKKNGFVFVETIVTIIVLTSALLLLYTSFHKILQSEKTRVYYDDVNYIYRTYHTLSLLKNSDFVKTDGTKYLTIEQFLGYDDNSETKDYIIIGPETSQLNSNHAALAKLKKDFNISIMAFFRKETISNIKYCKNNCSSDSNCEHYTLCNSIEDNFSDDMIAFLKTVNNTSKSYVFANDYSDLYRYFFVVEYNVCNSNNTNCRDYYSWVGVI